MASGFAIDLLDGQGFDNLTLQLIQMGVQLLPQPASGMFYIFCSSLESTWVGAFGIHYGITRFIPLLNA